MTADTAIFSVSVTLLSVQCGRRLKFNANVIARSSTFRNSDQRLKIVPPLRIVSYTRFVESVTGQDDFVVLSSDDTHGGLGHLADWH